MKQHLSNSIEFMRNREGLFLVLAGALFVQAPHTAEVFHRLSTSEWWSLFSWIHSAGFAIVLELAVLLFVVRGRTNLAWTFAAISVLMNVFYYYAPEWWTNPVSEWSSIVKCVVISIALPLAIAFYSHEVAGKEHTTEQPQRQPRAVKTVRQSERTEQLTVYAEQLPEQSVVVDVEQPTDWTTATDEHKRQYLHELLSSGRRINKTQLAKTFAIGRTTLYEWIDELTPEPIA